MNRRLKPLPGKSRATPQCCVPTTDFTPGSVPRHYIKTRTEKIEKYGLDPNRCSCHSSVELNGKHYCARHAGQVALAMVLKEGEFAEQTDTEYYRKRGPITAPSGALGGETPQDVYFSCTRAERAHLDRITRCICNNEDPSNNNDCPVHGGK